jgi:hypothetical protein
LDELFDTLDRLDRIQDVLEPPAERNAALMEEDARDYPPELPNQRYRRTFRLRGGWSHRVQRLPNGVQALTTNRGVLYNIWVQNEGQQAAIHRGRWQTDQQILDNRTPGILQNFDEAVQEAIDRAR